MIEFICQLHYCWQKRYYTHWLGLTNVSGCLRKYECSLLLPGMELWFLSRQVRTPVTMIVATVLLSVGNRKGGPFSHLNRLDFCQGHQHFGNEQQN